MVAATAAASTVRLLDEADQLHLPHDEPDVDPEPAITAWNARMATPLLVMSLLFVGVLVVPALFPDLPGPVDAALLVLNIAIWAFFAVDYAGRLWLAVDTWRFVRAHVLDLLIVLVPFFRPLRLMRLASLASRMSRQNRGALVADVTKTVTAAAVFSAFLGAALALDAEREAPETVITGFLDALWFAVGTMTAVPYGDVYPVTQEGRAIATVLMILGLVFVGLITAAIAAWFVGFIGSEEVDETAAELKAVQERLASVEALLVQLVAVPQQRVEAEPAVTPRRSRVAKTTEAVAPERRARAASAATARGRAARED